MYNPQSDKAAEFLPHSEIEAVLQYASQHCGDRALLNEILDKAALHKGLSPHEAAVLLCSNDPEVIHRIAQLAGEIKERYYGNRIVLFAPLYLSNHCVNGCHYCPYHASNSSMPRKQLTQAEIEREVEALQQMGHKRLAIEAGEHPRYASMEYLLESIETIYRVQSGGAIRRANVNIAATTVENYRLLKSAGIGTYILFQETYHRQNYLRLHPTGPKHDYNYHTEAMDRAMQGGLDDVGLGVLFGLSNYQYDVVGLLLHAQHLEARYGVGPHTISVPRICPADKVDPTLFTAAVTDEQLKRMVALLRISVPYTGLIVSTRESQAMRQELLSVGVSQLSGGSRTTVGGYAAQATTPENSSAQFEVTDTRTLDQVVEWLLRCKHIPSFCTACYREGRTGDRFMSLIKKGQIANCCLPNALITLQEYLQDYASPHVAQQGVAMIQEQLNNIPHPKVQQQTKQYLSCIEKGERDFRF